MSALDMLKHTHACTHAHVRTHAFTHAHARTHARTRARTHAHIPPPHTHTHISELNTQLKTWKLFIDCSKEWAAPDEANNS